MDNYGYDDYGSDDYGYNFKGSDYKGISYNRKNFTVSSYKFRDHRTMEIQEDKEPNGCHSGDQQPDMPKHSTAKAESSSSHSASLLHLKNLEYLASIKRKSSSMANFAAKLHCELFTEEERKHLMFQEKGSYN